MTRHSTERYAALYQSTSVGPEFRAAVREVDIAWCRYHACIW